MKNNFKINNRIPFGSFAKLTVLSLFLLAFSSISLQAQIAECYADNVVARDAMGCNISSFADDPTAAIGAPDWDINNPTVPGKSVSLGKNGGFITLEFTDNVLTNNGNADDDLFIYERGDVEASFIWLKPSNIATETALAGLPDDGNGFYFIASTGGATTGLDVDQIGTYAAGYLSFDQVKIVSTQTGGCGGQSTHGPDIDAVCALSSVPCFTDTDGDGVLDCFDPDDDGDGIDDECDTEPLVHNFIFNGIDENFPEQWLCGNNNDKVKVCQVPSGNPSNAHTTCVSPNAVQAHLDQGDMLGECNPCGGSPYSESNEDDIDKHADMATELEVFPNPVRDVLNVHLHGADLHKAQIMIYDGLGKIVWQKNLEEQQTTLQIDLSGSSFMTGIYMVTMISEEEIIYKRIMISK